MKAGDLGELALRNLREALLRNSLTTLGIAVGVASLVAMLSLGVGLQELATKRLSNSGLFDTVIVMSKSGLRGFGGHPNHRGARVMGLIRATSQVAPRAYLRLWMMPRAKHFRSCPMWWRYIRRFVFRLRFVSRENHTRRWWREFRIRRGEMAHSTG